MKKEMTKQQMKDYLKEQIEDKWRQVQNCKDIIAHIERQSELTENDKNVFEMMVNDKHNLVGEIIKLEELYKTFFGVSYLD